MLVSPRQPRKPASHVVIADSARNLFDIRLEMEDGLAKLFVSQLGSLRELVDDGLALATNEARNSLL